MAGVNKVILIGNLGNDPEMRTLDTGSMVTTLSLATSESWKDKNTGEKREKTEWHRVVFWGKPGEIITQYATKGSKLYVEGSLETRKWQDQEGNDRYTTEIKGRDFQFLGGGQQGSPQSAEAPPADGDDIPF